MEAQTSLLAMSAGSAKKTLYCSNLYVIEHFLRPFGLVQAEMLALPYCNFQMRLFDHAAL